MRNAGKKYKYNALLYNIDNTNLFEQTTANSIEKLKQQARYVGTIYNNCSKRIKIEERVWIVNC